MIYLTNFQHTLLSSKFPQETGKFSWKERISLSSNFPLHAWWGIFRRQKRTSLPLIGELYLIENQIERIQKRALRIICPDLSYSEAIEELDMETLKTRRKGLCTKVFKSIVNDKHHKIHHLLPTKHSNTHNLKGYSNFFLLFHLEELLKLYVNLFYRFCVTLLFLEIFEQKKSQIS
jgi:hypothetical protein